MTFVNPMASQPNALNFDFPVLPVVPAGTFPNVAPPHHPPEEQAWYGNLGVPPRPQGLPCLREATPGIEDLPVVTPWIDTIIHMGQQAIICHTGRLSGVVAPWALAPNAQLNITLRAVPVGGGQVITIPVPNNPILLNPGQPGVTIPNDWYWFTPPVGAGNQELVCVIRAPFTPTAPAWLLNETYKLIIDWNFTSTVLGPMGPMPVHGFDDSIAFHIMPPL